MPGLAGNQGWGSSGGPAYLRASNRSERDRLVLDHIERQMQNNNEQVPRYLPGVKITDYFRLNRSGAVSLLSPSRSRSNDNRARSQESNDNRARSQERRGGTTSGRTSTGTRSSRDNGDGNGSNKKNTSTTKAKAKKRKLKSNNRSSKNKKRTASNAGSSSTTQRRNNNRRHNNEVEAPQRRNNNSIREILFSISDLNSIGTYRSDSISRTTYNDNVTYLNNARAEIYGYPYNANNIDSNIRQSIDNAVLESIRGDRYTWPPIVSDVFGRIHQRRIPSTSTARLLPADDLSSLIRARIVNHFMDAEGGGRIAVSEMNGEDV